MSRARPWLALAALGVGAAVVYRCRGGDDRPPARTVDASPGAAAVSAPSAPPAADATLTVAVVDARSGAPIAGATITARRSDSAIVATATTDAAGLAGLALAPGRWRAEASRGGAPLTLTEAADWQVGADAVPPPAVRALPAEQVPEPPELPAAPTGGGALVGEVTVGGARPFDLVVAPFFLGAVGPGRAVTLDHVPTALPLPPRRFVGTTGVFRWDGLAPGSYAALVVAPGRGAALVRATVAADLAGNASAALPAAASVSGRVVDDHGGELAGATVGVVVDGLRVAAVTTDAHGTYLAADLPPGAVQLVASAPGCLGDRPTVTLDAGQRLVKTLGLLCQDPPAAPPPAP